MKSQHLAHVMGVPVKAASEKTPKMLLYKPVGQYHSSSSNGHLTLRQSKTHKVNNLGGISETLANSIREQVRLGRKISEAVKRKLSLGAKILQAGGVAKIFEHHFSVREGEKLLKASQCYLSTTAGPIPGLLFISTDKVAFCSEKSMKFSSPDGQSIRFRYKVVIPTEKISSANESNNEKRPSLKYIQMVTVDNFDFWFMGFLSYQKTLKYLQQASFQSR